MAKEKIRYPYTVEEMVENILVTNTEYNRFVTKLTVLDYMFNSVCFVWKKGRLVHIHGLVPMSDKVKALRDLKKDFDQKFSVDKRDKRKQVDVDKATETVMTYLHGVAVIENGSIIAKDKTPLKEDLLFVDDYYKRQLSTSWSFTILTVHCALFNLPDDIKPGYLKIARELYDLMWENPSRIRGRKDLLPYVGNRLQFLEEKQRRLQERREEQRKNFYNYWFGDSITKWPEVENFTLPDDEVKRKEVLKRKKDYLEKKAHYAHLEKLYGISNYFNNTVKIEYNDAISGFYRRRISPFTCRAFSTTNTTLFTLHTIDDSVYTAGFTRILPRAEATSICREFMRTIPHKGLKVKDFVEFFKNKEADYWDLEGNFEGDSEIRFEVVKE